MHSVQHYCSMMWYKLTHLGLLKVICSYLAGIAIWLIHLKHMQVLGVFVLLVLLDLITKWESIAYQMLVAKGRHPLSISAWDRYMAMPQAFAEGHITSAYMRKGFVNKVCTYVMATMAAYLFDFMAISTYGHIDFAVNLTWLYLGSTEFVSILENMRDGGNPVMGRFLEIVNRYLERKM